MKTLRQIAVFPLELILMVLTFIYTATEIACMLVGQLCQLVAGDGK